MNNVLARDTRSRVGDLLLAGRNVVVLGAAGAGRTTLVRDLAIDAVQAGMSPERILVLTARRTAASLMRQSLADRLDLSVGGVVVRTPQAQAFAVVRRAAARDGRPEPRLLTGADQDALLAEVLDTYALGLAPAPDWPGGVPAEALGTRGLRSELRDLIARAVEGGIDPETLAALGSAHGRPEWSAAARVYADYLDVLALRSRTAADASEALDASLLVARAADLVAAPDAPQDVDLLLLDDAQELTPAALRLVTATVRGGARLLATADPDAAVQTFRGARPGLIGDLPGERIVLDRVRRHGPALRAAGAALAERIGTPAGAAHRRATAPGSDGTGTVTSLTARSLSELAERIAGRLTARHRHDGVPWEEMTIVARSSRQLEDLVPYLADAGLPIHYESTQRPLAEEPVVRDLLDLVRVALGDLPGDGAAVARLLTGPLGRLDSTGLRTLRRTLRRDAAAAAEPVPTSEDLLAAALVDLPDLGAGARRLPGRPGSSLRRLERMVSAARARSAGGDSADQVLWAAWDASGLADSLRRESLASGGAAAFANHQLDALITLFAVAGRTVERSPYTDVRELADRLEGQSVAEDSLAVPARVRDAVLLTTPAGVAGEESDTVVVVGLQDGAWPDPRLRTRLLGAEDLSILLHEGELPPPGTEDLPARRRAVIHDELRLAYVAVTRARQQLVLAAVASDERSPSAVFDLLAALPDTREAPADPPAPDLLDERRLVAQLRRALDPGSDATEATRVRAAAALSVLAGAGVSGADPRFWAGAHPTAGPAAGATADEASDEAPLRLSPSSLETLMTCPLRWHVETTGGRPITDRARSLGTLLHGIAERNPHATEAQLLSAWEDVADEPATWVARQDDEKARAALRRLAEYEATRSGRVLGSEVPFRVRLAGVELTGFIDRIEERDRTTRIIDFKTGASALGDGEENLQLGAYQIALREGALGDLPPAGGAELVQIGTKNKSAKYYTQSPLADAEDPLWMDAVLAEAARRARGPSFEAVANPGCDHCPARSICPLFGGSPEAAA